MNQNHPMSTAHPEPFREILPQMFEADLRAVRTRMRLIADVPALRARTFESMREGAHAVLTDLVAERTGSLEFLSRGCPL